MTTAHTTEIQFGYTFEPSAFSPTGWFNADTLGLAVGAAVQTWTDTSGNSRDVTQSTAGKRTLYLPKSINGHASLLFDGVDDEYVSTALDTNFLSSSTVGTVFSVFKVESVPVGLPGVIWGNSSRGLSITNTAGVVTLNAVASDSGGADIAALPINVGDWVIGIWQYDGTNVYCGLNDADSADWTFAASGSQTGTGVVIRLGANPSGNFFRGEQAVNVFFNTALSQDTVRKVVTNLSIKYGISVKNKPSYNWTTIQDVIRPVTFDLGMHGSSVHDRVAGTGTLQFTIDNSEANSAGTLGFYSPGGTSSKQEFGVGITPVRVAVTHLGSTRYVWRGFIDDLSPIEGSRGQRKIVVTAVNWMDEAARGKLTNLPTLLNQRSDQVFQKVVENVARQPANVELGLGLEQYETALDTSKDESQTALGEFGRIAASELGFAYVKGDTLEGETVTFEDRRKRGTSTTSQFTITHNDVQVFQNRRSRDDVINRVQVQAHPRRVDDTTATFQPTDISNLVLWLNPRTLSGQANGTGVSALNDSSAQGNNASQSTNTKQPLVFQNALNGHPIITYDGIDDYLEIPDASSLDLTGDFTLIAVINPVPANRVILAKRPTVNDSNYGFLSLISGNLRLEWANPSGTFHQPTSTVTGSGWRIAVVRHRNTANKLDFRMSGITEAEITTPAEFLVNNGKLLIGAHIEAAPTGAFAGSMADVLIYGAALSDTDLQTLESYYNSTYGITVPTGALPSGVVLFTLRATPLIPRNTSLRLRTPYRDPDQKSQRAGGIGLVNPVATTDFTLNSKNDGTGIDLTTQLAVTPVFGGNTAELNIVNNGPQDGFLTLMHLRGLGLYDQETVLLEAADPASAVSRGENAITFDMPYQSKLDVAQDAAHYILSQSRTDLKQPQAIRFEATRNDALMTAALDLTISSRITLQDTVQQINSDFFINGITMELGPGQLVFCMWDLVPATAESYWVLGVAGKSEMDVTTRLAYGLFNVFWFLNRAHLGTETKVAA